MYNKVVMVGYLTRDVELRYMPSGGAVATIGIATNRRYKKQDGTQVDDTCFIDAQAFGRTAEVINQYLRKGSKILIEGRLIFQTWTDQQGQKRSKHIVGIESMQMMDTRQDNQQQGDYQQSYPQQPQATQPQGQVAQGQPSHSAENEGGQYQSMQNQGEYVIPEISIKDEDIPF